MMKAGVAALSPFLHTGVVIGAIGRPWGMDEEAKADLRAASPVAFRRGFAHANDVRISPEEVASPCPTLLVAGEGETRPPVRASNAALAALMPNARATFVAGRRHGWIGELPDLHLRMLRAWFAEKELPSELQPETTEWDRSVMDDLLGRSS